jgi:hypothetical protein
LRKTGLRVFVFSAAAALVLSGCGGDANDTEPTTATDATTEEPAEQDEVTEEPAEEQPTEEEPVEDEGESDVDEADDEAGDVAGEEPGVVELAEPVRHSEGGLELEVDAVRIIAIDELSDIAGEDLSEYLDDDQAVTFVGMRVTMRNTTDEAVDWYPGGLDSAVVLAGQQGAPSFFGEWGDTLRANAELEMNVYYESRVPADEGRAAGEFVWDVGAAFSEPDYETITDPELTITYNYP